MSEQNKQGQQEPGGPKLSPGELELLHRVEQNMSPEIYKIANRMNYQKWVRAQRERDNLAAVVERAESFFKAVMAEPKNAAMYADEYFGPERVGISNRGLLRLHDLEVATKAKLDLLNEVERLVVNNGGISGGEDVLSRMLSWVRGRTDVLKGELGL